MSIKYCPNCGSPVFRNGNMWECGWCENYGLLPPSEYGNTVIKISAAPEPDPFDHVITLMNSWMELDKAATNITAQKYKLSSATVTKVVLYQICCALIHSEEASGQETKKFLSSIFEELPSLRQTASLSEVLAAVRSRAPLFSQEAVLSEDQCGSFWQLLITCLPQTSYYESPGNHLSSVFISLSRIYAFFREEDFGDSSWLQKQLTPIFYQHWRRYVVFQHKAEAAKTLLRQGRILFHNDLCIDILTGSYPQIRKEEDPDQPVEETWDAAILSFLKTDPHLGLSMWRTLLDVAGPLLPYHKTTAAFLLIDFVERDWLLADDTCHLLPFLNELEDECFARQIFQSAHADMLQADLLQACGRLGRSEQGQRLLQLLKDSPYPQSKWDVPLETYEQSLYTAGSLQGKDLPPAKEKEPPQNAENIYSYCMVRIEGFERAFTYLAGDLAVKKGWIVEVPFGKNNHPCPGQVISALACDRTHAPWPPEQTKQILRRLPRSSRPPKFFPPPSYPGRQKKRLLKEGMLLPIGLICFAILFLRVLLQSC